MYSSIIAPFDHGRLAVDDLHTLYWEQSGNPQGQAIVVLHGGPGTGIDRWQQQLIDARHYRIICFDQRGAGLSSPRGELRHNTTQHLVDDIEALRCHLRIKRWLVMGGSWGSCLALAYAQQASDCVSGLILRGIFLGRNTELHWYFHGLKNVFPEAWHRFSGFLMAHERSDPARAFSRYLHGPDPQRRARAAQVWCEYEAHCSTLLPDRGQTHSLDTNHALILARIQTHYFSHSFFLDKTPLLDGVNHIRSIPGIIIQGRYDMICPTRSAYALHQAWPEADYRVVDNAGHAATEPGIRRTLTSAIETFKGLE